MAAALRLIVFVLLFLGASTAARAADRNQLVIGISQYPTVLNPLLDASVAQSYILGFARRPIMAYDQNWQPICMLCEEIPTFENGLAKLETYGDGQEGVAVTYTLREDARWGDAVPVTSADVYFTWEVGKNPEVGAIGLQQYQRIRDVTIVSQRTFTLHYDRVVYNYNRLTGLALLPAHIERTAYREPSEYREKTYYSLQPSDPGLYNGPYRITEIRPGMLIKLQRNEAWLGKRPFFNEIVIRVLENSAALENNLLSGDIDMIAGELGLGIAQAHQLQQRHKQRFQIVFKPGLLFEHIDWNLQHPILKDLRVRQALLYALNREAINKYAFAGQQLVAHSPLHPKDPHYFAAIQTYPYKPGEASALLEEAGWSLGEDGYRYNAEGRRLEFSVVTTAGKVDRQSTLQILQNFWQEVGVKMNIRNAPARLLFGEMLPKRDYGAGALFAWASAPEGVPRTTLHSEAIPKAENYYTGQNYTGLANEKLDRLIDWLERETDPAERRRLWQVLQRFYMETLPTLPLYYRSSAFVLPQRLRGLAPTGHQFPSSLWVENWTVEDVWVDPESLIDEFRGPVWQ